MSVLRRTTILLVDWGTTRGNAGSTGWRDQLDRRADGAAVGAAVGAADGAPSPDERIEIVEVEARDSWWIDIPEGLGLADDDVVVVAEAGSVPAPHALDRMLATYDANAHALVDARALPVELRQEAHDPEADPDPDPGSGHPVSGLCTLLDARALRRVGEAWRDGPSTESASRLGTLAEQHGLQVLVEPRAAIFRSLRVTTDGGPIGGDRSPAEVPARPSGTSLHPALLPRTSLAMFLGSVSMVPAGIAAAQDDGSRPFLSIVTRTQGQRSQCLEEALTCLAAQTDRDFELLLMCHRAPSEAVEATRALVEALPAWLVERTRVVEVERPGRAAPLNDGFELANGRYLVMLDDDDTVFEHWVETFHALEATAEGRLLRAGALQQPVLADPGIEDLVPIPVGNAVRRWPLTFELVDHLRANYTPCMTIAFPRGVIHDLGLRFDESLDMTEDWDLIVRAAGVVGVASAQEVTSVYRWWEQGGSSRDLHSQAEWDQTMQRVRDGFRHRPLLLPPGASGRFEELMDGARLDVEESHELAQELATSQQEVISQLKEVKDAHDMAVVERERLRALIAALEHQIELKDNHIGNIETMLGDREQRLTLASQNLADRRAEVQRLRQRLKDRHG